MNKNSAFYLKSRRLLKHRLTSKMQLDVEVSPPVKDLQTCNSQTIKGNSQIYNTKKIQRLATFYGCDYEMTVTGSVKLFWNLGSAVVALTSSSGTLLILL